MPLPLMPKATAVWLVENTKLDFDQIAEFCGMHPLEVQGIADGEVAVGIIGQDPIATRQLSREDIEACEKDTTRKLKLLSTSVPNTPPAKRGKGGKYTPVARRQDKPDAIAWLLKYHPEVSDAQVVKLIGTTKNTINAVRGRTHWNSTNIRPRDPVLLGLCTQVDLDRIVAKARISRPIQEEKNAAES